MISLVVYSPATSLSRATTRTIASRAPSMSAALSSARSICRAHVSGAIVSLVVDDAAVWVGVHDAHAEGGLRVLVDTASRRSLAALEMDAKLADAAQQFGLDAEREAIFTRDVEAACAIVDASAVKLTNALDMLRAAYDAQPVIVQVAS